MSEKTRRPIRWRVEQTRAALVERFPRAFAPKGAEKRPLKIGVDKDILAAMPEIGRRNLTWALEDYTRGPTYQRWLVEGAARVDLDGADAGTVSEHEAALARDRLSDIRKAMRANAARAATTTEGEE